MSDRANRMLADISGDLLPSSGFEDEMPEQGFIATAFLGGREGHRVAASVWTFVSKPEIMSTEPVLTVTIGPDFRPRRA
jgi:hypothetical protein